MSPQYGETRVRRRASDSGSDVRVARCDRTALT
jgi:hypothetical protein